MNLSDQQIQTFIEAWRKDVGETLPFEVAETEARRLPDSISSVAESRKAKDDQLEGLDSLKMAWKGKMRHER